MGWEALDTENTFSTECENRKLLLEKKIISNHGTKTLGWHISCPDEHLEFKSASDKDYACYAVIRKMKGSLDSLIKVKNSRRLPRCKTLLKNMEITIDRLSPEEKRFLHRYIKNWLKIVFEKE